MHQNDEWSPDEPLGAEAFEPSDEALDEGTRIDPDLVEAVENDPSLDPALQVDERELEEVGAELDDPEAIVTLEGGSDDPDGLGEPSSRRLARRDEEEGWDLDAPIVPSDDADDEFDEPGADESPMPESSEVPESGAPPKVTKIAHLDAHHQATVEKIFAHPAGHNIQWHDVLSLLRGIATVTEEAHGRYTVTLGSETETFDIPRHHDIDAQQVVDLRRMLRAAGIGPTSTGS
ncbi:MAG: hypothetical protein ACP5PM_09690 [Acidimicrobiales bacterium]